MTLHMSEMDECRLYDKDSIILTTSYNSLRRKGVRSLVLVEELHSSLERSFLARLNLRVAL